MTVVEQLRWRYATKAFDESQLVSEKKLTVIKEAFNLTATSYGLQPIKLVILNDKDQQRNLIPATMNQEQIAQASHVLVFCIETKIDKDYVLDYFKRVRSLRHTPERILKPFQDFLIDDFENKSQDLIDKWSTNQAYLAMGNILTVCALEGVDSCPMEGFDPDIYDEVLGLNKRGLKSVLLLPIGYRAKDDMFADFKKVRKELADSVIIL